MTGFPAISFSFCQDLNMDINQEIFGCEFQGIQNQLEVTTLDEIVILPQAYSFKNYLALQPTK